LLFYTCSAVTIGQKKLCGRVIRNRICRRRFGEKMIDELQEIASYFIEGSPNELKQFGESGYFELKRWWKAAQRWINRLLIAIVLWPIAMIGCAAWSTWMARKVVPFLALL